MKVKPHDIASDLLNTLDDVSELSDEVLDYVLEHMTTCCICGVWIWKDTGDLCTLCNFCKEDN